MAEIDFLNPLANINPRFTDEQLAEIIEWFDQNSKPLLIIFEGEPVNVITIDQLQTFLGLKKFHRRCYNYPTYANIMKDAENLKAGISKMLTKDQFIYVLDKYIVEPDPKHELKLAFKVFDTEKRSFLDIDTLRGIVTGYADIFDEAETLEFLRDANIRGDGNVFFEEFVDSLFDVAPELYHMKKEYLYENPDEDPSVTPLPPDPAPEEPPSPSLPTPPPPPVKAKERDQKGKKK